MDINLFGIIESDTEESTNNDILINKINEYKNYIDSHIAKVQRAYEELKKLIPYFDKETCIAIKEIEPEIELHDASKYSDGEFEAYRANFFPIDEKEKEDNLEAFEIAWKHHHAVNLHHPEHFYKAENDIEDMPYKYIIEMICDWGSFDGLENISKWYNENYNGREEKERIMTKSTIDKVNYILDIINKHYKSV